MDHDRARTSSPGLQRPRHGQRRDHGTIRVREVHGHVEHRTAVVTITPASLRMSRDNQHAIVQSIATALGWPCRRGRGVTRWVGRRPSSTSRT